MRGGGGSDQWVRGVAGVGAAADDHLAGRTVDTHNELAVVEDGGRLAVVGELDDLVAAESARRAGRTGLALWAGLALDALRTFDVPLVNGQN
jgi:hypothetical protein